MNGAASQVESVLDPAGPVAQALANLSWLLIGGATLIFVAMMALLAWTLLRRARSDDRDARGVRSNAWWLIGGGVVFPVVVLTALLTHESLRIDGLTRPHGADELVISVSGRLWWWEVRYRLPDGRTDVVLANEIQLPVGRPVTIGLSSQDVIHSLWIPALAGKVDLIPGKVNQLRLQADRAGSYRGQCAEFCGEQHARMALFAIATPPEEFDRWLAQQAAPAQPPADPQTTRGLQIYVEQRCYQCHQLRGLDLPGGLNVAPDLTHLASRSHLAAGTMPINPETLAAWIADPQQIKPGTRMPSYRHLDEASLQALAAFLAQLK